mgnify:CR=1 FL=1
MQMSLGRHGPGDSLAPCGIRRCAETTKRASENLALNARFVALAPRWPGALQSSRFRREFRPGQLEC